MEDTPFLVRIGSRQLVAWHLMYYNRQAGINE